MSDGLQIYGLICYPVLPGPHPVLIINHGVLFQGALGLNTASFDGCTQMAAAGWFVATSTYRGWSIFGTGFAGVTTFPSDPTFTRQSQGQFEFCGGEVDDSLNLLAAVKQLPQANGNQVVMWGHSHGSCITELAVERGAAPQIVVSLDGPTDFTKITWQVLSTQYGATWCDSCGPTDTDQLTARSSTWSGNTPTNLATRSSSGFKAKETASSYPNSAVSLRLRSVPEAPITFSIRRPRPREHTWRRRNSAPRGCRTLATSTKPARIAGPGSWGSFCPTLANGVVDPPTFLMYACPHSVCTGADRSPVGNEGATEHGAIMDQSWPEVANFVNHFASGWSASFPLQFVPFC
jgi:hypothetical protein